MYGRRIRARLIIWFRRYNVLCLHSRLQFCADPQSSSPTLPPSLSSLHHQALPLICLSAFLVAYLSVGRSVCRSASASFSLSTSRLLCSPLFLSSYTSQYRYRKPSAPAWAPFFLPSLLFPFFRINALFSSFPSFNGYMHPAYVHFFVHSFFPVFISSSVISLL